MPTKKPNILILWGDDIGIWNISKFSNGMMGYRTPNIDRVANEGGLFTDYYSQQSCTAGRACFITGQNPIRTGLTKVGMPGATVGLQKEDPTIAELLKPLGYATGQFGKNHLGDRNEFLPTVHGFDEFFGNLYHLNAEEEPELPDYPKDPKFKAMFGPRGVLHCKATDKDDADRRPALGTRRKANDRRYRSAHQEAHGDRRRGDHREGARVDGGASQGRQAVLPLVQLDGDALPHARRRKEPRQERSGSVQRSHGRARRADRHDARQARRAGIADNTIVMYSTDNGPENDTWPDGANTPFRGQKDSNWEGGWRVPCFIRWPGTIKPGSVLQRHRLAHRHVPDVARRRRQSGRHQTAARRLHGRRQEVQRPSRRLQPDPVLQRAGKGKPEKRDRVLQRRRRRHRGASRRLEVQPRRAARQYDGAMGRAVREAARCRTS